MDAVIEIAIQLFIFGVVFAASMSVIRMVSARWDVQRRLGDNAMTAESSGSRLMKRDTVSSPFLAWVQASTSLKDEKDRNKLRRDLSLAGFESAAAPVYFVIARLCLAIGLPILFLVSQQFAAKPFAGTTLILGALGLCGLGLIAPRAFVDNRVGARGTQLEQEFPDALDLMVVCVEAGLGIEAAFIRVGNEVQVSHPRIADAFDRVSDELRAGRSRADALRSMAERTNVDTVKSFVALLIQTDALGTSIGTALRTYSSEMRQHRFLKAEEKAMRIPVLLTVPLVACILPVMVAALLLPAGIDVVRQILPALAGRS